jgi:hypothetical protein
MDLVALGLRALIVPQDRRPQDLSRFVEQDQAVHLPRQTDGCDSFRPDACFL